MEQRNVFNAWQYRHLFTFQSMRGKNVVVMCNLCMPKVNLLSSSRYSTSNLKKHLERKHGGVFELFKATKPRKQDKSEPGPSTFDQIMNWEPPVTQVKVETPEQLQFEQEVTNDESQAVVDSLIFNFMMESLQPPSLLEQPAFKKLIEGVSGGMMVMTKETLVDRLQREQIQMREELKAKLDDVPSVCTTVDLWTARGKSYLTMMCHWVDPTDLQRKSMALACTRIRGPLTYDTVAAKIHEVHVTYSLEDKVQALVTDSGSNFVHAFNEFLGGENQEDEGEQCEFFSLNALLSTPPQEGAVLFLPPHQQCIAHVLSLVATEDLVEALQQHTTCSVYSSAMAKCAALWSKVHQPSEDKKPVKVTSWTTRWNFEYEAVEDLVSLNDVQLVELCERKNVAKLLLNEICFLKEYVEVLKPLAMSLNIFQGEDRCFFGLALPTLLTLKHRLREKKTKTCIFPDIIDALLAGIDRRFAPIFSNQNAKLASATMPQFRLWWLSPAERGDLQTALMGEAAHIDPDAEDAEDESDSDDVKLEDEFFNFGPGDSSNQRGPKLEVQRYLESTTKTLQCLQDYPSVTKLFLKFNTILTSSAPIDRLFSHGGGVSTPQQIGLSDEHLEQLLLLRYNGLPICTTV